MNSGVAYMFCFMFHLFIVSSIVSASKHYSFPLDEQTLVIDPTKLSFKLSFLWSKGYCAMKLSGCNTLYKNLPNNFTIHGLWPIYRARCDDSTEVFDAALVEDLLSDLNGQWPDVKVYEKKDKYKAFWKHEWVAHGKICNLFGVHAYFQQTLSLYQAYNVTKVVDEAGYPTTPESLKNIFPAGRKPTLFCYDGIDGQYYFFQLEFCLNNNQQYEDCPVLAKPDKTHCIPGKTFSYVSKDKEGFTNK